ncbi:MAG: peptide chain release factor N(5)-glutamine methyltransferase, partial [Hyphomicrobium sp.]
ALIRDPDRVTGAKAPLLLNAVARRVAREPVSRILGTRAFYGRDFNVTPDVLDPRADTETLIEVVLELVRGAGRQADPLTIADIGTGSGAIIVTLLAELPNARGIATDVSEAALAVARQNAERLGVLGRLTLINTRGLLGVSLSPDFVVSNPPYIPAGDIASLDPDVVLYDPHLALDGGPDGLAIYREIASHISELEASTQAILEIGAGQADDVEAIFSAIGARPCQRRRDLGGHVRVVALEIQR